MTDRLHPETKHAGRAVDESAQPEQMGLFGDAQTPLKVKTSTRATKPVLAADNDSLRLLGDRLPDAVRLGTSSWSFPGWQGLVWADDYSKTRLSRDGLDAYAQHPLLGCVGLDRTFYSPMTAASFETHARLVPTEFRFFVKAWQNVTSTSLRIGPGRWRDNPDFLNTQIARERIIGPALDGLKDKLGAFIFQLPPLGPMITHDTGAFASRLCKFLTALPQGPTYAFELRDRELYCRDVMDALGAGGGSLCLTVHPRAVGIEEQYQLARRFEQDQTVIRWTLGHGMQYADAKARYSPFDRIQAPDPQARAAIARITRAEIASGSSVSILINNKAEGSAPMSAVELAAALVEPKA